MIEDAATRRRARTAAILWGLFLLVLTSWPSPPEVPLVSAIPHVDKLVHGILYGVEGFFLYLAVAWPGSRRSYLLRALTIGGALAVFGTLDEIHQAWIPGRMPAAGDVVMDTVGGFVGALTAAWATRRSRLLPAPPDAPPASPRS